jgi:glucose-6-phosphate 1-dehydrogenase
MGHHPDPVRRDRRPCRAHAVALALRARPGSVAAASAPDRRYGPVSHDNDSFRAHAEDALKAHVPGSFFEAEAAARFLDRVRYVTLDATDAQGYRRLADAVGEEGEIAIFLSTAPSLFKPTIDNLEAVGLAGAHVRLALEKPLGSDLQSSRSINDAVASAFPEQRTFRIDHYLGKETVQNLLALRFANLLFEPIWSGSHIDHVQITVSETIGLEGRGDYYDGAGALRDMVQNQCSAARRRRDGAAPSTRPRCATRR